MRNDAQSERRLNLLLVEDEPSAAKMLAKGLREHSFAVDVAQDGEAALYQISIYDYDLVILDVMLPRKDGLEVCREMRALGSSVSCRATTTGRDGLGRKP